MKASVTSERGQRLDFSDFIILGCRTTIYNVMCSINVHGNINTLFEFISNNLVIYSTYDNVSGHRVHIIQNLHITLDDCVILKDHWDV